MLEQQIKSTLDRYAIEYGSFIGIKYLPKYDLKFKEVSQAQADIDGFDSLANTQYIIDLQKHILCVSKNAPVKKYVIFHEFTHMLDSELYIKGNKVRKMGLAGYTEYHASQIGFAQLLGAEELKTIKPFSMHEVCETISGKKSVFEYVREKQETASSLFSRKGFPVSLQYLSDSLGVLFNYWGLRSICEMYATDFAEVINNGIFIEYIPSVHFCAVNRLMHGWLDEKQIEQSMVLYNTIFCTIAQQWNLRE